jgi:hypothetical protein
VCGAAFFGISMHLPLLMEELYHEEDPTTEHRSEEPLIEEVMQLVKPSSEEVARDEGQTAEINPEKTVIEEVQLEELGSEKAADDEDQTEKPSSEEVVIEKAPTEEVTQIVKPSSEGVACDEGQTAGHSPEEALIEEDQTEKQSSEEVVIEKAPTEKIMQMAKLNYALLNVDMLKLNQVLKKLRDNPALNPETMTLREALRSIKLGETFEAYLVKLLFSDNIEKDHDLILGDHVSSEEYSISCSVPLTGGDMAYLMPFLLAIVIFSGMRFKFATDKTGCSVYNTHESRASRNDSWLRFRINRLDSKILVNTAENGIDVAHEAGIILEGSKLEKFHTYADGRIIYVYAGTNPQGNPITCFLGSKPERDVN